MSETKETNQSDTILIVDDNKLILRIFEKIFAENNYEIILESNSTKAEELAVTLQPDIILLDVMMPYINGFTLCSNLKNNEKTKHIPVIFISARSSTEDIVQGFQAGGIDYLTKPIQKEEVLTRVRTHLSLEHYKKELAQKNAELQSINANLEKLVEEKTKALISQEKQAIIGSMITGVVHNFRSPLTAILGYLELLEDELSEESKLFVNQIQEAAEYLEEMMNGLMIKSRMDQSTKTEQVDLNALIHRELEFFNANLRFKHEIEKELHLDDSLPKVTVMYSDIAQVFENLVNNAIDAMWKRPLQKLSVSTEQDQNYLYIKVSDTGCGIEADKLPMIFDPFYSSKPRKDETKEGEPYGTGLGLHTCQTILKRYNGFLKVQSEPDQGSTFTIVLPKTADKRA